MVSADEMRRRPGCFGVTGGSIAVPRGVFNPIYGVTGNLPVARGAVHGVYRGVSRFRHAARIAGGYTLLAVGVIGLFLPVIQGTLLIIAGAAMLGWDLTALKKIRRRIAAWWRRER